MWCFFWKIIIISAVFFTIDTHIYSLLHLNDKVISLKLGQNETNSYLCKSWDYIYLFASRRKANFGSFTIFQNWGIRHHQAVFQWTSMFFETWNIRSVLIFRKMDQSDARFERLFQQIRVTDMKGWKPIR